VIFKTTIVAAVFLGLHLLSAIWHPNPIWGADLLYAYPGPVQLIFLVMGVLLLVPSLWETLFNWLGDRTKGFGLWSPSPLRFVSRLMLILFGCSLFVVLSSSIHLLGDGYLYLRELDKSVWQQVQRADRAPLTFLVVARIHELGRIESAEGAYRLMSYMAGALYLLLIPMVAGVVGGSRNQRNLVLGIMATGGFMQLFFGYVENYALLLPGIVAFLLSGLQVLRGRLPVVVSSAILGVLIPLHFFSIAFLPALLVLGFVAGKGQRDRVVNLGSVLITPLVSLVCFQLIQFDVWSYLSTLGKAHFLSLIAAPDFYQPYRLLSPSHFLDFLNLQILTAPAAVMGLFLFQWRSLDRSSSHSFLLAAATVPLLLGFLANPEIGAFRDWDVMSLPTISLSLYVAYRLVTELGEAKALGRVAMVICGAAVLHTSLWIGINSSPRLAEDRFVSLLSNTALSKHARSYGWGTLGTFYRLRENTVSSLRAYQKALEASPENPRHWISVGNSFCELNQQERGIPFLKKAIELKPDFPDTYSNLGTAYHSLGRYQEAVRVLVKAVEMNPNLAGPLSNLGAAYHGMGEHEKAVEYLLRAIELRPNYGEAYSNLGAAYHSIGQYEKAIESIRQVISISPDLADGFAYMNLGAAYHSLGKYDDAVNYLKEAVKRSPNLTDAHFNLGTAFLMSNRPTEAKPHFLKVLRLNPNDPQAPMIRQWLRANP
jgi:tetratricopeptide (TPR) repeat protein